MLRSIDYTYGHKFMTHFIDRAQLSQGCRAATRVEYTTYFYNACNNHAQFALVLDACFCTIQWHKGIIYNSR